MQQKCNTFMDLILRRIAAGREASTPQQLYADAISMRGTGYMPDAIKGIAKVSLLEEAIKGGHLLSRAYLAKTLICGEYRLGIDPNAKRAFLLVHDSALGGCHYCQEVLAFCYLAGIGCDKNIPKYLEFAKKSIALWHNAS
jgi:TPR repeat protein